jgi:hypothetical protein
VSRPSGRWPEDDYDMLENGAIVGRISLMLTDTAASSAQRTDTSRRARLSMPSAPEGNSPALPLARPLVRYPGLRAYTGLPWLGNGHNRGHLIGGEITGSLRGHLFACLLWTVIHLQWAWGDALFHASCLAVKAAIALIKEGITGMLTVIKVSLVGSTLMLLASCTGYLTNYQTPCVRGHVCECVQYTTVYRSWLDCRDYGRVKSKAY